uniref:C3H1-type domain-containing protein n=1 Tax=Ascaris lumbricoides TaxID=6252 RepID=A0A0M3I7Y3_ASCLU
MSNHSQSVAVLVLILPRAKSLFPSAISLLTARLRARSPTSGAVLETGPYRLELLPSANFLASINISKLICERQFKSKNNGTHSTASLDTGLASGVGPTLAPPYPLPPLNLIQQFAFPYRLDISSPPSVGASQNAIHMPHSIPQSSTNLPNAAAAAAFNVMAASANAHAAAMLHQAATLHPYAAAQMAAAAAAAQMLQQQHPTDSASNQLHHLEQQSAVVVPTTKNANDVQKEAARNDGVGTSVCSEKLTSPMSTTKKVGMEEEDTRSHREAKIEVFSEDEEDYDIGEIIESQVTDEKTSWENNSGKAINDNGGISESEQQRFSETHNCSVAEYSNEYPPLPTAGCSDVPLRYSAVVKGVKPATSTIKPSFSQLKESVSVHSHRSACTSSSMSTQTSQWDEVVVERGGKFSKPAPQCIHWNNPKHRLDFPCRFWHPREQCRYYPNCSSTADECGFAHPFCADFCHCPKGKRDPQKNHRLPDDRYFGMIAYIIISLLLLLSRTMLKLL